MRVQPLQLPDVLRIEPKVFSDRRGFFLETWQSRAYAAAGISSAFVQDNLSSSCQWTLRGLHYQLRQPQGKLVQVLAGEVFDVAVDLRRSSPTFGRSVTARLSAANHHALWIPPGFAHGFLALAEGTLVHYKVTEYWAPEWDRTLLWDDPALGIDWPLPTGTDPVMTEKDRGGAHLANAETYP